MAILVEKTLTPECRIAYTRGVGCLISLDGEDVDAVLGRIQQTTDYNRGPFMTFEGCRVRDRPLLIIVVVNKHTILTNISNQSDGLFGRRPSWVAVLIRESLRGRGARKNGEDEKNNR